MNTLWELEQVSQRPKRQPTTATITPRPQQKDLFGFERPAEEIKIEAPSGSRMTISNLDMLRRFIPDFQATLPADFRSLSEEDQVYQLMTDPVLYYDLVRHFQQVFGPKPDIHISPPDSKEVLKMLKSSAEGIQQHMYLSLASSVIRSVISSQTLPTTPAELQTHFPTITAEQTQAFLQITGRLNDDMQKSGVSVPNILDSIDAWFLAWNNNQEFPYNNKRDRNPARDGLTLSADAVRSIWMSDRQIAKTLAIRSALAAQLGTNSDVILFPNSLTPELNPHRSIVSNEALIQLGISILDGPEEIYRIQTFARPDQLILDRLTEERIYVDNKGGKSMKDYSETDLYERVQLLLSNVAVAEFIAKYAQDRHGNFIQPRPFDLGNNDIPRVSTSFNIRTMSFYGQNPNSVRTMYRGFDKKSGLFTYASMNPTRYEDDVQARVAFLLMSSFWHHNKEAMSRVRKMSLNTDAFLPSFPAQNLVFQRRLPWQI
ncbi:MAG: hypothetical protein QY330_03975 [Candidatus Dojkabacteria bacterium]|uniref:Uncharacterized protein n=2 Tax=Candidatus Dojkabacteria TaxID=74243 RepID=A0A952AKR3_9BACT|nr:hypothetical protein [Candidatus Dojkabacteria bacterium]WKZ27680.1 MAG: hypothetical protein QY330_03975 [Candidatus Dojkabacteria bacterium]